jgi:hypothetical protein
VNTENTANPIDATSTAAPRRRKRLRGLSIRALMLLVLVVGGWLGWTCYRARVQREAVAAIKRAGGEVRYNWEQVDDEPGWLRRHLGPGFFEDVTSIWVPFGANDALLRTIGQLPALQELTIIGAHVGDLEPLRSLNRLRSLDLTSARIDDLSLEPLESLPSLNVLSLRRSRVTDAGMRRLQRLTQLRELTLDEAEVTDEGLRTIAGLSQLESLSLNSTSVTDAGLLHLTALTRCQKLYVGEAKVTPAGIAALRAKCPWMNVFRPSKVYSR